MRGAGRSDLGDLVQPEVQFPVEQDLPQLLQVRIAVQAVVRGAPRARGQQPDRVIVVQGPH
jgi:hypothetical protein